MKTAGMIVLMLTAATIASAGDLDLNGHRARTLEYQAFRLDSATSIDLEAIGIRHKFTDDLYASAWIVDADGHLVWSLDDSDWRPENDHRYLIRGEDRMTLPAGDYVAYLYPGGSWWTSAHPFKELGRVFNDIADMLRSDDPGKKPDWFAARCRLNIEATGADIRTLTELPASKAMIALAPVGDSEVRETVIEVSQSTDLQISACGERDRGDGGLWDLGWIEHAATGEPVWTMDVTRCKAAGGSEKNVHWSGSVAVEPGVYRIVYATDSSHAWGNWNERPPADPRSWGMLVEPGDVQAVTILDQESELSDDRVVVRWLRLGDEVRKLHDVEFDTPVRVRIRAMGEGGKRSMYDAGSITDRASGRVVWAMTWANTKHAGGADKNRLYEGTLELPAGQYRFAFTTDDSHAFGAWNVSPPREPFRYGMVVQLVE